MLVPSPFLFHARRGSKGERLSLGFRRYWGTRAPRFIALRRLDAECTFGFVKAFLANHEKKSAARIPQEFIQSVLVMGRLGCLRKLQKSSQRRRTWR
eukprot:311968-Amphidinium_carterae.1